VTRWLLADPAFGPAVFGALPDQDAMRVTTALAQMEVWADHARVQWDRYQNDIRELQRQGQDWPAWFSRARCDVHFYFVCWSHVGKMMQVATRAAKQQPMTAFWGKCHARFDEYDKVRDRLEHLDERLPGGRKADEGIIPGDLGMFSETEFSLGGLTWDVGPASIQRLEELASEFVRCVRAIFGIALPATS
jgi:hypothetical protein